jgi:hypothetical protein
MKTTNTIKIASMAITACILATIPNAFAQGDNCNVATAITTGTYTGSTVGASPEIQPFCGTSDGTGGGVWYTITGTNECSRYTVSTCTNTSYDSKIRVFTGSCGALTCVTGNDDFCGVQSQVSWDYTPGVTYYILVHGFSSSQGAFELNVTEGVAASDNLPPVITDVSDQSQLTNTTCMATFSQPDLAQSFIPSASSICGAGIELSNPGSGNLTIQIWDGLPNAGGAIVAQGTETYSNSTWVDVNWASVAITAGNTYYLVPTATNTSACWRGNTSNPYPNGNTFANAGYSPFTNFDYTFDTYSSCGGPLADINAECEVTSLTPPTAQDACVGTVTGTTNTIFPITTQGTTTVTWTYDDGNGNTSTQTQNVIIADVTAPVADINSLPVINAECEATIDNPPTATDNCVGSIAGIPDVSFPITTQGTTTITWTYDDGNGNVSTQTQNVVIQDVTSPVADQNSLTDITATCEVTSVTAPTATDNCTGSITGTPDVTFPITTVGTTVITWTYDDGNGNTSTQTQNIVISGVETGVTQNGGTLTADATGLTYQWLDCDNNYAVLTGETNVSFTPTELTGNYAVEINDNGCVDTSDCFVVDFTGLSELEALGIRIYPNPTSGMFTVDAEQKQLKALKIVDLSGRVVYEVSNLTESKIDVDISNESSGSYYIQISGDFGSLNKKIVLN